MKKFVGYVNGKTFYDEKEFNEAANEAVKNNDGSLAISSYYQYTSDDDKNDEKQIEDVKDDKFVSAYEYFLGERKPDLVSADSYEYTISDELKKKLAEASNINDIKKSLEYHIAKLDDNMRIKKSKVSDIEENIEKLQNELYERVDDVKNSEAMKKYYDTLSDIVDKVIEERKEKKGTEDKPEATVQNESLKKFLGIPEDASLYSFLKITGLLK